MEERIFDKLEYIKINNVIVDKETGEIIESKSDIELALEEKKINDKYDKCKETELKRKVGIVDKKETHRFNFKKDSHFIKIYRTEKREYLKTIKMTSNAGLLLFYLENYIEYETNRVAQEDGKSFTNTELIELTGLSDKPFKNAFNEIEDKYFIKRVGNGRAREIYFNPYLACSGNEILKSTLDLFKDYTPVTAY